MRRNAALVTMLVAQLGVVGLGLFLHLHARVTILAAFREYDTELPRTAALGLSPWFLPAALGFGALSAVVALLAPLRRSRRSFVAGLGLMVSSTALMFAAWAAIAPLFQPG